MSFTIKCNQCGTTQNISDLIKGEINQPNIMIDIANENFDNPEYDYILIQCQNKDCNNTFEF